MIYICVPTHDECDTVGILLWKVRKVFAEFPREYHILLLDDGSTDRTAEVLEPYKNVLPLTVLKHEENRGYAAAVETLMRAAVERTDRPKRDSLVLLHADFTHDAERIADFVRGLESGADLVVAQGNLNGAPRWYRWLRSWAARRFPAVGDIQDVTSGFLAARLISVRNALATGSEFLTTEGWAANAELQARIAQAARRVMTVDADERHDLRLRPTRIRAFDQVRSIWRQRRFTIPEPAPTEPRRPPRRRRSRSAA
jgi:glycosyltransferase involved in cell wall biosynthesis